MARRRHLPHGLRAHLRRLLLPDLLLDGAGRFADDQRTCQRKCPASEAVLYTYRNPGEDIAQAVSVSGQHLHGTPERLPLSPRIHSRLLVPPRPARAGPTR